ncbi:hypothetical protein K438DRAFT_1844146 [Mycena galopus ATCC 62051]|nr:hypothetical protein K438DRAFT_1844146 [Mycena galopus ATCC 62051]
MAAPSAKRQRTENASITRSDIWYKDGSVVLQTENTQFRVHWSIISRHSSFFRDLEDLPQPPNQSTVDGCPVVELHDSGEDVEYLLNALYDPHFLEQKALPLAAIGALIRMGRKYDFKTLLDSAVARITFENPATLDEFDAMDVDNAGYEPTRITNSHGFFFDLLVLAQENGIVSALPAASFRALTTASLAELFQGIQRADETLATLPLAELQRCVIGREKLLTKQYQPGYTLGWLRKWPYTDCSDPALCDLRRQLILHQLMDDNVVGCFGVFCNSAMRKAFCTKCSGHISKSSTAGRKKMWEELPGIFDLPPWDQLKNDL